MENASKALIIAGSILLSILIIALGMYIFSSTNGVTDDTTLSQMETSTFNGKFEKFKGLQNGTQVAALIDALISNFNGTESNDEIPNVAFYDDGANGQATVNFVAGTGTKSNLKDIKKDLQSSHRYYVEMDTNDDTDLIHGIVITYNKGDSTAEDASTLAAK